MHKFLSKLGFLSVTSVFLCGCSVTFWVQLNSGNLFDYCEYSKFGWIDDTKIYCNLEGVDWINPWIFNWYNKVKSLDIMWNEDIKILKSNTFVWLDNLEYLSLSDNDINNIELWAFNWLSSLKRLYLNQNQINTLSKWLFDWLTSLEELNLRLNKIDNIEDGIFSRLSNLINLDLSENSIDKIEHWDFLWLDSLKSLDLGYNEIINFDDRIFEELNQLTRLDISFNCLSKNEISGIENKCSNNSIKLYNSEQEACYIVDISPDKRNWFTEWPVIAKLNLTWDDSTVSENLSYLDDVPDLIFTENGTQSFIRVPPLSRNWITDVTVDWIKTDGNTDKTQNNRLNMSDTLNTEKKNEENEKEDIIDDYNYSIYNPNYSDEMNEAYQYAYKYWITTMNQIEKAKMNSPLTRIAMAKMLSKYATSVLWKKPDTSKTCSFNDVPLSLDSQYDNWVSTACQLWIMWIWIKNFKPNGLVTRAEFATALSRLLYWTQDWTDKYYSTHISTLYNKWIISNTNHSLIEKRWYVMLMLMRSAN